MNTPLPPAVSCEMSAVGPNGGGCVVAGGLLVADVVVVVVVVRVESAFLPVSLEQAATPSSATHAIAIANRRVARGRALRRSTVAIGTPSPCRGSPVPGTGRQTLM